MMMGLNEKNRNSIEKSGWERAIEREKRGASRSRSGRIESESKESRWGASVSLDPSFRTFISISKCKWKEWNKETEWNNANHSGLQLRQFFMFAPRSFQSLPFVIQRSGGGGSGRSTAITFVVPKLWGRTRVAAVALRHTVTHSLSVVKSWWFGGWALARGW